MTLDFSSILLIATVVSGVILCVPALARLRLLADYARAFFLPLLLVLVVRSFLFEPFRIPSESMMPGLLNGDFIVVDKFSYGLRLPMLHTKVLPTGEPERGDVVVFRSPADPSINLIKRLVGLPGDHIAVVNNHVAINGKWVSLTQDETASELAREQFDASEHVIMFLPGRMATDFEGVVPAGHYFFMGDNRNNSEDSRFAKVGFVPEANLVGHARRIWMNWRIPGWPEWRRIGMKIN